MSEDLSENTEYTPLVEDNTSSTSYLAIQPNDNDLLTIYSETDMLFFEKDDTTTRTIKDRIGHILNTTNWNMTILFMIACDVLIVVLELYIQLDKNQCNYDGNQHSSNYDMFVTVVDKLGYLSDFFLCVFTTELILHLYCHGYKYLFESWLNFVDSFTVMITFVVTILITFYFTSDNDTAQGLIDVLIILRFWRIFCLVESVVNATQLEANIGFREVLTDLNAEVRILENRKNCYAEKLIELGYDLSELENEYLFPKDGLKIRKLERERSTSEKIDEIVNHVTDDVKKAK